MNFRRVLVVQLVLFSCALAAFGQSATSGSVVGTVSDSTGAAMAGVEVEITSAAINITRKATTGISGQYIFPDLAPGTYKLRVAHQGFQTATVSELRVEVTKTYTIDFKLEVGSLSQTVEVSAEAAAELQTTHATVGNVLSGSVMPRLPTLTRQANELLTLQPGVTPAGEVTGSRADQSTFTLDGIDVTNNSVGGLGTFAQLPQDGVEEFRVGVANPTAFNGRGAGGQVAVISKRGGSQFHGNLFWYHQNDNLNAHDWGSKRLGKFTTGPKAGQDRVPEPETKDNRFGFRVGGPIYPWSNKLFFLLHYEGRRFPRASTFTRLVPTDTLRQGVLRFRDSAGNVNSYTMATSTACGSASNSPCDPRGLGLSPSISALWALLPAGNDTSQGDGLNTIGYTSTVGNPVNNDFYRARLDYNLSTNWSADFAFQYFGNLQQNTGLLDIRNGTNASRDTAPTRQNFLSAGLRGQITPTMTGEFRFGWVRQRTATDRWRPNFTASQLAIPGTQTTAQNHTHIALDLGALGGTQDLLGEPIDAGTQVARFQTSDNRNFQWNADMTWTKGKHLFQFGAHILYLPTLHTRDDKVVGSLGALVAQLDAIGNIVVPATSRPRACSTSITTNCVTTADQQRWNRLLAVSLGMVDNVSILAVRDSQFNPLPFGDLLVADTKLWGPEMYFQDAWRLSTSLTLTLGVSYGWQTAPVEKLGRQTIMIDAATGTPLTANGYLSARRDAAAAGQIFNPNFAFVPIQQSPNQSSVFNVDWNNIAPRIAAAWNPTFTDGPMGWIFGGRKTVVRGGFSIVYDRQNTVQSVIIPTLGIGFGQTLNVIPLCDASGTPGAACSAASTNHMLSFFRVGRDGAIPTPTVPSQTIPVSPAWGIRPGTPLPPAGQPYPANAVLFFPEILSFQVDPDIQVGKNYAIDFTWQREMPFDMILEFGYVGRFARLLPQSMSFGQIPYTHVDPASGQSFAQAFDAVALQLRAGVPAASVTPQPWFQNNVPGGTAAIATNTNFVPGNAANVMEAIDRLRVRNFLQPFNNWMVQTAFMRASTGRSNYNAAFLTLNKRMSKGLMYTVNYTFSRSLDQLGAIQNAASVMPNNFDLDAEYGPSPFDNSHLLNVFALYELPFGKGRWLSTSKGWLDKLAGGWYISNIFTARSGDALTMTEGSQVWGGTRFLGFNTGMVPTVNPFTFGNTVRAGYPGGGSGGTGTTANPATGGSGLNLFANPDAVFTSFRRVELSRDGRSGRANPIRGLPRWNLDASIGKKTAVTERVTTVFSVDFFNVTNHVDFNNPSLDVNNRAAFGVITGQFTPANRTVGSRWIQLGLRIEF